MTYREIRNTIWKYPLIAIAVVIALSLVMGLFWFFNNKTYDTRIACQNIEECECDFWDEQGRAKAGFSKE